MMNQTIIFCDGSYDRRLGLNAWAYVILHKSKEFVLSGHYISQDNSFTGEYHALLKSIGRINNLNTKSFQIYTDVMNIALLFNELDIKTIKKRQIKQLAAPAQVIIAQLQMYKITLMNHISYIPRDANFAHKYAYEELQKAKDKLYDVEGGHARNARL